MKKNFRPEKKNFGAKSFEPKKFLKIFDPKRKIFGRK